jgi:hypothetical protein
MDVTLSFVDGFGVPPTPICRKLIATGWFTS